MFTIFILVMLSIIVALAGFLFFLYSAKTKQFEDIEAPKHRMLDDEDDIQRK